MNRINTYIECYIAFVYHKHRSPNKYSDLNSYLEDEFKYVACNWDNEYDIVKWLGSTVSSLLTPTTICTMIQAIQKYYGDDPCLKHVYLNITPDNVLRHYCYSVIHDMSAEKIKNYILLG